MQSITLVNLNNETRSETLLSADYFERAGGPSGSLLNHCVVQLSSRIFVLGGSYSKREIFEVVGKSNQAAAFIRLSTELLLPKEYGHSCAALKNKIWICGGEESFRSCFSIGPK